MKPLLPPALLAALLLAGCQSKPRELPQPQDEPEEACPPPPQFGYTPQEVYPYR
ncbi:hypothetical protein [Hymenobacter coalescens]